MGDKPLAELLETYKYAEDQRPCLIAFDKCGCPKAAHGVDASLMSHVVEFIAECHWAEKFEMRPVAFVRNGGLIFDCAHQEQVVGG
jgi:hypothetical protein